MITEKTFRQIDKKTYFACLKNNMNKCRIAVEIAYAAMILGFAALCILSFILN